MFEVLEKAASSASAPSPSHLGASILQLFSKAQDGKETSQKTLDEVKARGSLNPLGVGDRGSGVPMGAEMGM
eukprot:CAMPEP_0173428868 /NCGR_PEP_ID=MMETSP1357-20121228/7734_1 /TAXON_ID=77926 /ORGANISM="Hemiselmis rufescens, Strain PCC563" /LENGTH=71 /DNA_ID=CAMNT_0014392961 /DNA_START=169 /DNA_END=384 /DNA_ORIENTATION=+